MSAWSGVSGLWKPSFIAFCYTFVLFAQIPEIYWKFGHQRKICLPIFIVKTLKAVWRFVLPNPWRRCYICAFLGITPPFISMRRQCVLHWLLSLWFAAYAIKQTATAMQFSTTSTHPCTVAAKLFDTHISACNLLFQAIRGEVCPH